MRYLFILCYSVLFLSFHSVSAQDSALKLTRKVQLSSSGLKSRDSLSRVRFKKRRHLDSVKRIHLRDSLRAGYTIKYKGHSFNANQPSGRRLADSLDHPSRFSRPKALLNHADSLKYAAKRSKPAGLLTRSDSIHSSLKKVQALHLIKPADSISVSKRLKPKKRLIKPESTDRSLTVNRPAQQISEDSIKLSEKSPVQVNNDSTISNSATAHLNSIPATESFEAVIDDSIPVLLQPLKAADSSAAISVQVVKFIKTHIKLDSLRQRLTEFGVAKPVKVYYDPHRPFAKPGKNRNIRETWIVWVLLIMIGLITLVKVRFPKDLGDIVESLFNDRMIKSNRDSSLIYSPSFIFMFFCFCLTAALAMYEYIHFLNLSSDYKGLTLYFIMTGCILGFLLCKLIIYRLSAAVFNIDRIVQPYLSFQYITIANFTLFCTPFLVIFSFYNAVLLPHLVVWIPFIFLAFLLFMYIRSVVFFISNFELPKFYLFLYFCTLEVCPLIIVFKLING